MGWRKIDFFIGFLIYFIFFASGIFVPDFPMHFRELLGLCIASIIFAFVFGTFTNRYFKKKDKM